MNTPLTSQQHKLHERALALSRQHRKLESEMLEVLQVIDQSKLYKKLGFSSLFVYAVGALGLTEATAYGFITVSRKAREVSQLNAAIREQKLSVAKASRLVAVLTPVNAATLIEFAQSHSTRDTESEVAKIRPQARVPDRAKVLSQELVKLEMSVSKEIYTKLMRVQSLLANKENQVGFEKVLDVVLEEYLQRHDPVEKAERALKKSAKLSDRSQCCSVKVRLIVFLNHALKERAS